MSSAATHPATPPHGRVRRIWLVLALGALALQVWLLYSTRPPNPASFAHADKLVHLGMFGGVAGLFLLARAPRAGVLGLSLVHAVVSELIQWRYVPGRSGSPLDVVADTVGILLAALLAPRLARRLP